MIKLKKETILRMKAFVRESDLHTVVEHVEDVANGQWDLIAKLGRFTASGIMFYPTDFEDETTMKTEFKRGVDEIPEHYKKACGTIEPRQFLKMMPFQLGNACKYILRCSYKGAERQDLMKALDYLEWAEDDGETPFNPAVYYLAPFFANDIIDALFEANGEVNYNGARNLINSLLESTDYGNE